LADRASSSGKTGFKVKYTAGTFPLRLAAAIASLSASSK
jgi:hypothetical protein